VDDLLTKQNISVETDCDRVILSIAKNDLMIPYNQAFKISAGIASAGRECMRLAKEPRENWREMMKLDDLPDGGNITVNEVSKLRRSTTMLKKFDWRVDVNGEMISLWLGNDTVRFHFETGFKIAQWLRLGAAQSKRWAGDTSKSIHASGRLTDGETNYKLGLE
jgi:hypothetical protein